MKSRNVCAGMQSDTLRAQCVDALCGELKARASRATLRSCSDTSACGDDTAMDAACVDCFTKCRAIETVKQIEQDNVRAQ